MRSIRSLAVLVVIIMGSFSLGLSSAIALESALFCKDAKLEAAAVSHPAHILSGHTGEHVAKIQQALKELRGAVIDPGELQSKRYGPSTAKAVLEYKKFFDIRGPGQQVPDDIVGIQTTKHLDGEMAKRQPCVKGNTPVASGHKRINFLWEGHGGRRLEVINPTMTIIQQDRKVGELLTRERLGLPFIVDIQGSFTSPNFTAEINGVIDPPKGEGIPIKNVQVPLVFPPDKFTTSDFLIVQLKALTDPPHRVKATSVNDATSKLAAKLKVEPKVALGKIATITIGEGELVYEPGVLNKRESTGKEEEYDILYYSGGFIAAFSGVQ